MPTTLSPRDIELLLVALRSTKTEFAIDYEQFAKGAKLKNKHTAAVIWSSLKKKLEAMRKEGVDGIAPSPGGPETPKSTKGRKCNQVHEPGADADDDETLTPSASKKGKRTPKRASPVKDDDAILGAEDGGDAVKPEPED